MVVAWPRLIAAVVDCCGLFLVAPVLGGYERFWYLSNMD